MAWKTEDLKTMLDAVENIGIENKNAIKKIYNSHDLKFPDKSQKEKAEEKFLRPIFGDIHTKVLGRYLKRVLGLNPKYETNIIEKRRFKADIEIQNIIIEVKSHGMFNMKTSEQRFETLVHARRDAKYIWVAFREREAYIKKTKDLLNSIPVETFFFSSYKKKEKPTIRHKELKNLIDYIKTNLTN